MKCQVSIDEIAARYRAFGCIERHLQGERSDVPAIAHAITASAVLE
jgi:hypothetical protein